MGRFAFFALFLIAGAQAAEPTRIQVNDLLQADGTITLEGGQKIRLPLARDAGARVEFVDLKPGANWAHPARIEVRSSSGKLLQSVDVRLPPRRQPVKRQGPAFSISTFDGKYKVAAPENFHALLINGSADERHYNDFSFLYRVLVQVYGYSPKNIFVADSAYLNVAADLDGDRNPDIGHASTIGSVTELMKLLATKLTDKDQLLIATNDHGDQLEGESTLYLYDGQMKASVFTALLKAIPAGRVLSIHEPCYSGGFVRGSVGDTRAAMSAATELELSWASHDLVWNEYIYRVISAFARQTHDGKAVDADADGDGKISAREAHGWAVANDKRPESPRAEDGVNSGFLAQIGLGF